MSALVTRGTDVAGAVLSEDGMYRYRLWRGSPAARPALFVMLNPSTADHSVDDPTIRRCLAFAAREGCHRLEVVNLFALRATDPRALAKHADPTGPENGRVVGEALARVLSSGLVICAWGAHPTAVPPGMVPRVGLWCLGTTKDGSPRHPLYVRADAPLVPWTLRDVESDDSARARGGE